jgi:long-chain acyl-CoA synthetase
MYPGQQVKTRSDQPAFIMATTGESVTYGELEARAQGLKQYDHYAIFMENNSRYVESCAAGERSGLYYTPVNSYLTADELAYILQNSQSQILVTSQSRLNVAKAALKDCPNVKLCLVVDGRGEGETCWNLDEAVKDFPTTPIADERIGAPMLYSSGTTGRPKGIVRPVEDEAPDYESQLHKFITALWTYRPGMIYLSPAPLYHSAPQVAVAMTIRIGGTAVIMERFDPVHYLELIEKYRITHTQLVPTMFSRMLKLPEDERSKYDLSSLEFAVHAAAPCPVPIKEQMIDWWGPIIHEYYGATEALGFAACNSEEWLAHKGTVGKVIFGGLHILDDEMQRCQPGETGTMWFETAIDFEYFGDAEKTAEAKSVDGKMSTVGDMGYLDEDGYLHLTDRKTFMIISGGVNIYPQECENLLISHPKVSDAAVFGVPNVDMGEEVKAVIELMPGHPETDETAQELMAFCKAHLASMKCPASIDFTQDMPRLPTGKLYKRKLRDAYWPDSQSRII